MGKDGERAGSIKGEASNGSGVDVMLVEDTLDRGADTTPDVVS